MSDCAIAVHPILFWKLDGEKSQRKAQTLPGGFPLCMNIDTTVDPMHCQEAVGTAYCPTITHRQIRSTPDH